jgi:hypothetical protein
MKHYLIVGALAVAVALGCHALTSRVLPLAAEGDQTTWLQREFELAEEQIAAVQKLQAAYQPICAEHCRQISELRAQLASAPTDARLRDRIGQLEIQCNRATLAHLRAVAALMPPAQASRFLTLVEPKVSRHEHEGPLGLK